MKWLVGLFLIVGLYFVALENLVYVNSSIHKNSSLWADVSLKKNAQLKQLLQNLQTGTAGPWLGETAPVLMWHEKERYFASEPLELLEHAELWYREIPYLFPFLSTEEIKMETVDLGRESKVLYKSQSPAQLVSRLYERQGLQKGLAGFELRYDPDRKLERPAPLLWRFSFSSVFASIQKDDPNHLYVPIEFWYHVANNFTGVFFGNHAGDWESFIIIFEVRQENSGLLIKPRYYYTSAHHGGSWHCAKDMTFENGRPLLYSALGTHATFTRPGTHWIGLYPDETGSSKPWETWKFLRPFVKEPYYGFSGSWGHTFLSHSMSGPIMPGPEFKYIPGTSEERDRTDWKEMISRCGEN